MRGRGGLEVRGGVGRSGFQLTLLAPSDSAAPDRHLARTHFITQPRLLTLHWSGGLYLLTATLVIASC